MRVQCTPSFIRYARVFAFDFDFERILICVWGERGVCVCFAIHQHAIRAVNAEI